MGKVTKKVWIILIIVALALPIFVGCEPEPEPVDPVAVAKAAFLNALNGEVAKIEITNVATVTLTGQNFEVEFTSTDADDIRNAAISFFDAVVGLSSTAKLKINNESPEYTSTNKGTLKAKLISILFEANGTTAKTSPVTLDYSATVKYGGQTFNLAGTVEFKDIPDLDT